ncbi:protein-disulfide isomerase [Methylacidiphilum sp. Yel]|jgi:protein-disulfide isomerase|uniref:DsbA family protein n=1 Tax=Methylacidiphilum sp. Yel TaxID=1847730 RepID=UPI00106CCD9B|nr:thioredoxin domain-containing protein [Methylacidiphilum sp. Yel]TFE68376.1 protein-disulfide isomerase [Methylacidiphilum sp. Yel]
MDKIFFLFLFCFFSIVALLWGHPVETLSNGERASAEGPRKYLFPLVGDWMKGPIRAAAFLIEYVDFQCPVCKRYNEINKQLLKDYQGRLLIIYRHKPSPTHPYSFIAALSAEAAGKEGCFWQMTDLLFEKQDQWANAQDPWKFFRQYAQSLNIVDERFLRNLKDPQLQKKIYKDIQSSLALGATTIPSFFLNAERIPNPQSYEDFKILIEASLIKSKKTQVHEHADIRVVLDGKPVDFSLPKFQSKYGQELDPYVHLHHGNGKVLHKHKNGINLGYFFNTLGMDFGKDHFTLDTGKRFEPSGNKVLLLFVNGRKEPLMDAYEPKDLDRILLYFGPNSEELIAKELALVSDEACIYSLKCPQRGMPPEEECTGQLGSDCQ